MSIRLRQGMSTDAASFLLSFKSDTGYSAFTAERWAYTSFATNQGLYLTSKLGLGVSASFCHLSTSSVVNCGKSCATTI